MGPDRAPRTETDPTARAWTFVVASLAARAQFVAEIESKLRARRIPPDIVDAVVAEARRLGFLDDGGLAGRLADGFRSRGYGRRRAAEALRRRGVPAQAAAAALEAAFGDVDEARHARAALASRSVRDAAEQQRAVAFLVRRGHAPGVAWQVVRERARARPDHGAATERDP